MAKNYIIRCKNINNDFYGSFSFNNAVFEAAGLLPGEKASVNLLYGKDKGRAEVVEILEPSPERVEPPCSAYGKCGGCRFLHTNYKNELRLKTEVVKNLLERYGEVMPCLGMGKDSFHYRNKVHSTLSLDRKGRVISGLYEETTHKLIDIESCAIETPAAAKVMKTIRKFMNDFHLAPYNEDIRKGTLRHVLFRTSKTGDTLVVPVCGCRIFPEKKKLAEAIMKEHPFVKSVVLNYNTKKTSFVLGDRDEILTGPGYITDSLCGITFRISPHSFYQVNTVMAEKIYADAVKLSGIGSNDTILDAYCGIGTIAAAVAKMTGAKEITGVELNPAAVKDARESAESNNLGNLRFAEDDAADFLNAALGAEVRYSCIIMDPPRSGASEDFLSAVKRMSPQKLIYISCNPLTLARDMRTLAVSGYKAKYIRPYDMFPHTGNVEVLVILEKAASLKDS